MRYAFRAVPHALRSPFRVAHGASTTRTTVFVRLGDGALAGTGEGALVPYYPYALDDLTRYLAGIDGTAFAALADPGLAPDAALAAALAAIPDGPAPARCALDVAVHDAWARALGVPLWQRWGLDPAAVPPSSFTLSIPDGDADFDAALDAVAHLPVLKLKVGTGSVDDDVERRVKVCVAVANRERDGHRRDGGRV